MTTPSTEAHLLKEDGSKSRAMPLRGRSGALRAEPATQSQAEPPATIAGQLLELVERVEAASGPDRELDALVFIATSWPDWQLQTDCEPFPDQVRPGRIQQPPNFAWLDAPKFTASLDAAMSLVPEGWCKTVTQYPGRPAEAALFECELRGGKWWHGKHLHDTGRIKAATPALALTAASLRALATGAAK